MKKSGKVLLGIIIGIVILIAAALVLVNLFADRAVKAGIETAATKALNVGVSLDKANLSVMQGKLALQNLSIKNPPGYQHDKLLQLKDASVTVDVRSLLSDAVHVKEIKLDGAEVVMEQRGVSGNNIQDVIKSLPSGQKTEPSGRKLHIDNLEISNITVKVKLLPIPGKADTVTLTLTPIKMTNLGSDNKLDLATLTGQVILAIAKGIAEQGIGILPRDMIETMNSTLGKAIDLSKGIFGEGKGASEKALKGTEEIGKGIQEGLKGLLKKKD